MSIAYQGVSAQLQYGCSTCVASSTRARYEVCGLGQGTTEVGVVGRVRLSPQGAYRRPSQRLRAGLLNEGVWQKPRKSALLLKMRRTSHELVQRLLGHSSITMTLVRYSHWMLSIGRDAANGMDEALGD